MFIIPWGALIVFFDIYHQLCMCCHPLSCSLNQCILSHPHALHLNLHVSVHSSDLSINFCPCAFVYSISVFLLNPLPATFATFDPHFICHLTVSTLAAQWLAQCLGASELSARSSHLPLEQWAWELIWWAI